VCSTDLPKTPNPLGVNPYYNNLFSNNILLSIYSLYLN